MSASPTTRTANPLLLDLPDTVVTERLLLRPPRPGDGAALYAAVAETLPELRGFLASLPWVAGEQSVEASECFCRNGQANFLARRDLPFLIFERDTNRLLGATGLHRPVWETPRLEVGYWRRASAARRGVVTEAVMAMADYAFAHTGVVRLEILSDCENLPSRRVAERCGFALEGILRSERRAPDGSLRDTCVYARVRDRGTAPPATADRDSGTAA
jgi:RimJ/RimL family protein N-acetyltransferase